MCAHKERARAKKICVSARVDFSRFLSNNRRRVESACRSCWILDILHLLLGLYALFVIRCFHVHRIVSWDEKRNQVAPYCIRACTYRAFQLVLVSTARQARTRSQPQTHRHHIYRSNSVQTSHSDFAQYVYMALLQITKLEIWRANKITQKHNLFLPKPTTCSQY